MSQNSDIVQTRESERIAPSFTPEQAKILQSLVGEMGSTKSDVLKSIFIAWLSEKGITPALIRKRLKI